VSNVFKRAANNVATKCHCRYICKRKCSLQIFNFILASICALIHKKVMALYCDCFTAFFHIFTFKCSFYQNIQIKMKLKKSACRHIESAIRHMWRMATGLDNVHSLLYSLALVCALLIFSVQDCDA
jgi:hypothetical protein